VLEHLAKLAGERETGVPELLEQRSHWSSFSLHIVGSRREVLDYCIIFLYKQSCISRRVFCNAGCQ
jgi:hypothetical protein